MRARVVPVLALGVLANAPWRASWAAGAITTASLPPSLPTLAFAERDYTGLLSSVAVAVMSSDARFEQFGWGVLQSWGKWCPSLVVYVDTTAMAQRWSDPTLKHAKGVRDDAQIASCCPGNETLGLTLASAQYKLEYAVREATQRFPMMRFYLFSDDDTYWNVATFSQVLYEQGRLVRDDVPTTLFPAAADKKDSFCPTHGPFMLMNGALARVLSQESVISACRDLTVKCYPVYRRKKATGFKKDYGPCPHATRMYRRPYEGALYNNDHLINVCLAGVLAGRVQPRCLRSREHSLIWPYCGVDSPHAKHTYCPSFGWDDPARGCKRACAEALEPGAERSHCTTRKLFRHRLPQESSGNSTIYFYNLMRVQPDQLLYELELGERAAFGHRTRSRSMALRLVRERIVAYHHIKDGAAMRRFHACVRDLSQCPSRHSKNIGGGCPEGKNPSFKRLARLAPRRGVSSAFMTSSHQ